MERRHGKKWSNATWEKIEDINTAYDMEAQRRFLKKIMVEDNVDYDEAVRLTQEEPMYSLGWKMCSPAIMMSLASKKGRERFRKWLTPEEDEIFVKEVVPMGIKGMLKSEMDAHSLRKKKKK